MPVAEGSNLVCVEANLSGNRARRPTTYPSDFCLTQSEGDERVSWHLCSSEEEQFRKRGIEKCNVFSDFINLVEFSRIFIVSSEAKFDLSLTLVCQLSCRTQAIKEFPRS